RRVPPGAARRAAEDESHPERVVHPPLSTGLPPSGRPATTGGRRPSMSSRRSAGVRSITLVKLTFSLAAVSPANPARTLHGHPRRAAAQAARRARRGPRRPPPDRAGRARGRAGRRPPGGGGGGGAPAPAPRGRGRGPAPPPPAPGGPPPPAASP